MMLFFKNLILFDNLIITSNLVMFLHIKRNGHTDYFKDTGYYFNNKHEHAEKQKILS